jgi:hypothetical protein
MGVELYLNARILYYACAKWTLSCRERRLVVVNQRVTMTGGGGR